MDSRELPRTSLCNLQSVVREFDSHRRLKVLGQVDVGDRRCALGRLSDSYSGYGAAPQVLRRTGRSRSRRPGSAIALLRSAVGADSAAQRPARSVRWPWTHPTHEHEPKPLYVGPIPAVGRKTRSNKHLRCSQGKIVPCRAAVCRAGPEPTRRHWSKSAPLRSFPQDPPSWRK